MISRALLAALVLFVAAAARAEDAPLTLPLEPVVLDAHIASQRTDVRWGRALGETLRIGAHVVAIERADAGLRVAARPGAKPLRAVQSGETVEVEIGSEASDGTSRPVSVLLEATQDDEGAVGWTARVRSGWRLTYDKIPIELVDLNGDGRLTTDGLDGYRAPGNPLTLPLGPTLTIGADRLTLGEITRASVVVTVERLAEERDHRVGLASINAVRLRHGLPPVELDAELSAACTAHAAYLKQNGWNGYTNPHTEDPDAPGYTEAGARAARRGVIMQAGHSGAVRAYFQTYYHRAPFIDPFVQRVGISTGERWISVMDAASAAPVLDARVPEWRDPVLVPADGAIDVETHFCRWGEVPEPASRPASRGFPLTLLFARWDHGVTDVNARLVRVEDGEEVRVETLVPDAIQESKLMGVVPAEPLLPGTTYRVTYRLERYEEPDQLVTATFTTRAAR